MKNYAILILVVLMCFKHEAKAQKIHFCDTTNKWRVLSSDAQFYPNIIYQTYMMAYQDTIMRNNASYRKLFLSMYYDNLAVREDTILGKVYYWDDSEERVLYDYNWQVGDTVTRVYKSFSYIDTFIHVVASLDSTQIDGLWYKAWNFFGVHGSFVANYWVVEGIGCLWEAGFPLNPQAFEGISELKCFSNRGMTPALSPAVNYFDNNTTCTESVSLVNRNGNVASVIPNPITSDSKLIFSSEIDAGTLTIYNHVGQCLVNKPIAHQEYESLGDKINTPGIYFYRLTDEKNRRSFTGKFTKN